MTDKQIIIDGCDVSGCEFLGVELTKKRMCACSMIDFCNEEPNCYYKQLKRKEQSEEKLVKQIQTICEFINNRPEIFKGVNGSVDKIITDYAERKERECEELNADNISLRDRVGKLERAILRRNEQLDQLKAENDELKEQLELNTANAVVIDMAQRLYKLKQTLTEIKEIAEGEMDSKEFMAVQCMLNGSVDNKNKVLKQILQKISKVEDET